MLRLGPECLLLQSLCGQKRGRCATWTQLQAAWLQAGVSAPYLPPCPLGGELVPQRERGLLQSKAACCVMLVKLAKL